MADDLAERVVRLQAGFDEFYQQMMPVLTEFVERLGARSAHEVLLNASAFVDLVADAFDGVIIDEADDRIWLLTRIGYFVGEYLVQAFGGHWFVNDLPNSRYYARYVVGSFGSHAIPNAQLDPFLIASQYVDKVQGRNLRLLLSSVTADLIPPHEG